MANTALLRTLLLPPLFALALYLALTYLLLPLYRRHRERATYTLLPGVGGPSPSTPSSTSIFSTFTSTIGNAILRAAGTSRSALYREGNAGGGWGGEDEEFGVGDEELEEGVGVIAGGGGGGDAGRGAISRDPPSARRLSRDLEGGFMDDSDEEDGHGGRR